MTTPEARNYFSRELDLLNHLGEGASAAAGDAWKEESHFGRNAPAQHRSLGDLADLW